MPVFERINSDLVTAMKSHDEEKTSLLRMLKSAIKNAEISNGKELTDTEVFGVLEKQAKQRRDAADQYEKGDRAELAQKELAEADIIATYLPAKMSEEEVTMLVDAKIAETGASSMADMGKVIQAVLAAAGGSADGGTVSQIVKKRLG